MLKIIDDKVLCSGDINECLWKYICKACMGVPQLDLIVFQ